MALVRKCPGVPVAGRGGWWVPFTTLQGIFQGCKEFLQPCGHPVLRPDCLDCLRDLFRRNRGKYLRRWNQGSVQVIRLESLKAHVGWVTNNIPMPPSPGAQVVLTHDKRGTLPCSLLPILDDPGVDLAGWETNARVSGKCLAKSTQSKGWIKHRLFSGLENPAHHVPGHGRMREKLPEGPSVFVPQLFGVVTHRLRRDQASRRPLRKCSLKAPLLLR